MELQWETIDKNKFNIFMRDLSENVSINLKYMIEDLNTETKIIKMDKNKKKNYHKHQKPVIKKKDLIISEQNKLRLAKELEKDHKYIEYLFENVDDNDPYQNIQNIKNEKYKIEYECMLLEKYWKDKKKYLHHIFNLYYHLNDKKEFIDERYLTKLTKIKKILNEYECKSFMIKELGHLLPPLDFWNQGEFKLDKWQEDCIKMIYQKKSILVKAPTSSGKTFIAMATGIIHKRILYICPAKPIAYQVGSKFIKMGYKVHFYLENHNNFSHDDSTNIFIGTPDCIEDNLYKINPNFDYVVYDEIHMIDKYKSYENLIRCFKCNFIALSATIENIEYLKDIFDEIHEDKQIEYIEYKTKFMNQQRWILNNKKIEKLHPCSCMESEKLEEFKMISFSPYDCYELYQTIYNEFESLFEENEKLEDEIDELSIDNYFIDEKLLTLDEVREYEIILKNKVIELNTKYRNNIKCIENKYKKDINYKNDNLEDIFELFKDCEKNDLLPCIYFHLDESVSKEIFYKLYTILNQEEMRNYPYHYEILKKKNKLYQEYKKKREIFSSNIKIKTKDAHTEKSSKLENFDNDMKNKFISDIINYYENCKDNCRDKENESLKIKNLNEELNNFKNNPDFREQDIFKKHNEFCFTRGDPMSGSEIREIRREIKNSTGKNISYEDPLFQLLKRGIGIYIQSMPDVYNWILQRLMTEKKLGIIISDKTLCLGIDLPIRSVILSGYKNPKYTISDYLQMSGRAGRRGLDNQGNIIFHNVKDYKNLMKSHLPKLELIQDKNNQSYNILKRLNNRITTIDAIVDQTEIKISSKLEKLLWLLRKYKNIEEFIIEFNRIEKKLFMEIDTDREYKLLEMIDHYFFDNKVMVLYKSTENQNQDLRSIKELGDIVMNINNSLDSYYFKITKESSNKIFMKCKSLLESI